MAGAWVKSGWQRAESVVSSHVVGVNIHPSSDSLRAWLAAIRLGSHAVMKSEKGGSEIGQNVIGTHQATLGWKDVDTLAQRSDITCPNCARVAVNREVKSRLAEALACRGDH